MENTRVVLSPCPQYCPCEASEQEIQNPKTKRNEIEHSFLHNSNCFDELIILVWSDDKIELIAHSKSKLGQKWLPGLVWAENWLFWS